MIGYIGPHAEIAGFYAAFVPDNDEPELSTGDWNSCAHAKTIEEAVELAYRRANGRMIPITFPEAFK